MNFRKEKEYREICMDINRNVSAKYQKMKKLNKSEERERDQILSEFIWKICKPPSKNSERSQDLSLTPRKFKFKSHLAEKKQQLSKSKKFLLEKSKDLDNMKNQLEIRQASVELLGKENGKEHSQNRNLRQRIQQIYRRT